MDSEHDASRAGEAALWGVPLTPEAFVESPALVRRLERWVAGSSPLVVDAPSGYGKSTAVAAWLRSRGGPHPAVWISCGDWVRSAEAVWETFVRALIEIGMLPATTPVALGHHAAFVALQSLDRPIVVVYDGLDRTDPPLNVDELVRVSRQVPLVRTVIIVSGSAEAPIGDTVDREVIESSALAWDAGMVRQMAQLLHGAAASRLAPAAIADATGGRAAAVLHYLAMAAPQEPAGRGEPHRLREVALEWSMGSLARHPDGAAARRALLILSLAIRMPAPLLGAMLPGVPVERLVTPLVVAGLVRLRRDASGAISYEVPPRDRGLLEGMAVAELGDWVAGIHDRAAAYHLTERPALAIHHLARAGRVAEAIELMKRVWSRVGGDIPVVDFRSALAAIDDQDYRDDLEALSIRLLNARLPPSSVRRPDLEAELLAAPQAQLRTIPDGGRMLVAAATVQVLVARSRVVEAVALAAELTRALPRPGEHDPASLEAQILLWTVTAEVYLLAARPRRALAVVRRAEELMAFGGGSLLRFDLLCLAALARAFGGEPELAARLIVKARALAAEEGRPETPREYPLLFAEVLIAHARLDAGGMERAAAAFRRFGSEDRSWAAAASRAEAYAMLYSGRPEAALAVLRPVLHGVAEDKAWPVLRILGDIQRAELAVTLGRPQEAVELLDGAESPPGHAICIAAEWASAHLAMAQPRIALRETEACVEMGVEHSLRTLPAVLLRRAVAHERLNHPAAADSAFLDAFLLLRSSGVRAPYVNLPRSAVVGLLDRLAGQHPEFAADIADTRRAVEAMGSLLMDDQPGDDLSEREIEVLRLIAAAQTVPEMAATLFVSPNTVKSQIASIYRKLGVSSRAEASDIAARRGLVGHG